VKAVKYLQFAIAMSGVVGGIPALYIPALLIKHTWTRPSVRRLMRVFFHPQVGLSTSVMPDVRSSARESNGQDEMHPGSRAPLKYYGSI
jgi:hypothetical protein